eukprot:5969735-Prymnesium_polylepis.2
MSAALLQGLPGNLPVAWTGWRADGMPVTTFTVDRRGCMRRVQGLSEAHARVDLCLGRVVVSVVVSSSRVVVVSRSSIKVRACCV